MARIAASLKSTVIAPTKSSLSKFVQQLQTTYQDLSRAFNGGVSYGDGSNSENIDGSWASVTTPTPAGTNFTVTHGLNRIPVGVHVTQKNAFCDVLTVSSTTTTITLQASAAGAAIKLFIFLLLLCLIPVRSDAQGAGHNNIALQTIKLSGNSGYSGNITIPIPGATITVCNGFTLPSSGNTCTGLASIYSCPSLVSCALSNPTNADNNGNYNFFAAGGNNYVVSVGGIGLTTYSYVWSASLVSGSTVTNAINLVGPGTVTGNYTHSGTETFANINKVVYADQQAGATADVKIANCIAALSSGGICDATGFGSVAQTLAAPVTVTTNNITLKIGQTRFTHSGVAFIVNADNFELDCSGFSSDFVAANSSNANWINYATDGASHSGFYVHGCQADGNAANQTTATYAIQSSTASGSMTNFRIIGNYLHDHKRASNSGSEIQLGVSGTAKGVVSQNICLNHACVAVFGTDILVSNNIATNSDDDAFAAVGGNGLTVSRIAFVGNSVNGTTAGAGIDVVNGHGITANGNTINGAFGNGIIFWDNSFGIGSETTDSEISGNVIIGSGSSGISCTACARVAITGNTVKSSANDGIYASTPSSYVTIAGNSTMNNGTSALASYENAIHIEGANNVQVIGNTCSDDQGSPTQQYGLSITNSSSADVNYEWNTCLHNTSAPYNVAAGVRIATPGLTLKTGSGAGNYTGANTAAFVSVDTTNLCTVITVPNGWKLKVDASGVLESVTAAVAQSIALVDAGTTCAGGGVTALAGTRRDITPPALGTFDVNFAMSYVLTGDGAAHSISLAALTSNAADSWGIQNTSAAAAPSMTFTLMPSN